jgi:ABC-type sugar transport system ATPase subunit
MADDEVTQRTGSAPLLEVHDVGKHFGGVRALVRGSLKLAAGTTVALAGENGAGKSTLIKVLSGAIRPDAGQVLLDRGGRQAVPDRSRPRGPYHWTHEDPRTQ